MDKGANLPANFFGYFDDLNEYVKSSNFSTEKIELEIMNAINQARNIYVIGNGGSASTSEHFATDMSFVRIKEAIPLTKIEALTANSALMTALSNDIGYDFIFSHQLIRKAKSGDLLLVISASGNSQNLIEAINSAKSIGMRVVALLGFDGGKISQVVEDSIIVKTPVGAYGPVEDVHLAICHYLALKIQSQLIEVFK